MSNLCSHCGFPVKNGKHIHTESKGISFLTKTFSSCVFFNSENSEITYLTNKQTDGFEKFKILKEYTQGLTPVASIEKNEYGRIIKKNMPSGILPLSVWKMKYKTLSSELMWSWFKNIVLDLKYLETNRLALSEIKEDLIFIQSFSGNKDSTVINKVFIEGEICEISEDEITDTNPDISPENFIELFLSLPDARSYETDRNVRKYIHILTDLRAVKISTFSKLHDYIKDIDRIYQHSEHKIEVSETSWLKKAIFVIAALFSISMFSVYLFGQKKDPEIQIFDIKSLKFLIKKAPGHPEEILIEKYAGKWNKKFLFNRINMSNSGYLYINLNKLRTYELQSLTGQSAKLGLNNIIKSKIVENPLIHEFLCGFNNPGNNFKYRIAFLFLKKDLTGKNNIAPAYPEKNKKIKSSNNQTISDRPHEIKWLKMFGPKHTLINDDSPPVLMGASGELLKKAGYLPDTTSDEIILLYWNPPQNELPRSSVWDWLLGGILPTTFILRIYKTQENLITFAAVFKFSTVKTAKQVAEYMKKTSSFIIKINISQTGDLVLVSKTLLPHKIKNILHNKEIIK